ncbi:MULTISPECIES: hypothetical protein [unclassified Methylobacterium]|uniref:hypothetical protein n=1 Tax=unclassified Methylobacterium TaxID=2615210 RepID=UPI00164F7839|nr:MULTISPECIES: hypothetical protein [unclassified Methylobacterium]
MTTSERSLLRAEIALLKSMSPTKGPALRYREDDWKLALAKISHRLTYAPYRRDR